jgi:N-acetylglucosaminyl-diphospho-decaprenol L-rhamnosyltransferase
MQSYKFSLSIVSHGHKEHVERLITDLIRIGRSDFEVLLTLNIPESLNLGSGPLPFKLELIKNELPKGFAANHNAAFLLSHADNFVILNPDIKLTDDPFDTLLDLMDANPDCICAPLIVNQIGQAEDSARNFPNPIFLLKKFVRKLFKLSVIQEIVPTNSDVLMPDWVAGMFIAVPCSIFKKLNGLSERYFMYYEDVDFCARARQAGYAVLVSKHVTVIHEAQRDSHRKPRYLIWHLTSAIKFFTSPAYLQIRLNRLFYP